VLRAYQVPNAGLVDATSANDVLIASIAGGSGATPALFNADFMSFTRYIVTITTGTPGLQALVNVINPLPDSSSVQWTVGQLVTFRFRCESQNGCLVKFDPQTPPAVSAYSTNDDLNMTFQTGWAITFQVESFSLATNTHKFFELYRTSSAVGD
jgi:hypothetical protein